MATQNGVIDTSSGDLKRAAAKPYDFENDGGFDGDTETIRTDVPMPANRSGDCCETQMHRWNGSSWVLVDNPSVAQVARIEELKAKLADEDLTLAELNELAKLEHNL